jgi:hypothetical protein
MKSNEKKNMRTEDDLLTANNSSAKKNRLMALLTGAWYQLDLVRIEFVPTGNGTEGRWVGWS